MAPADEPEQPLNWPKYPGSSFSFQSSVARNNEMKKVMWQDLIDLEVCMEPSDSGRALWDSVRFLNFAYIYI